HRFLHLPDLHSFPTRRSSDLLDSVSPLGSLVTRTSTRLPLPRSVVPMRFQQSSGFQRAKEAFSRQRSPAWKCTFQIQFIYTVNRSEEHTSELQSRFDLVCRLL